MNVTQNVILDLLPSYFEGEVSQDSKTLVENYFIAHPEFALRMKNEFTMELPKLDQEEVQPEEKMLLLKNTQMLLRLRTICFATSLFGTLFPILYFTFGNFEGETVFEGYGWIWTDVGALSAVFGLVSWAVYLGLRYRMRTSEL